MSNFKKQTTAAGNAIRPAAVAMTKCPPLLDRDTRAHVETISNDKAWIDDMVAAMTPHGLGPVS